MKGPFYTKDGGEELKLIPCCKDCAFRDYPSSEKDIDATCFMNPCPCMPIYDEEEHK